MVKNSFVSSYEKPIRYFKRNYSHTKNFILQTLEWQAQRLPNSGHELPKITDEVHNAERIQFLLLLQDQYAF